LNDSRQQEILENTAFGGKALGKPLAQAFGTSGALTDAQRKTPVTAARLIFLAGKSYKSLDIF
jgi:hypothetical protein